MIIIETKSEEIRLKIPNNLSKTSESKIILKNTETKKEYSIEFIDESTSDLWYVGVFDLSSIPVGEYEYIIDDNRGLLRIGEVMNKKVYDKEITFRSYGD